MNPSASTVKKIVSVIKKGSSKYLTVENLSQSLALYPEKIAEMLSFFNPLITMDHSMNVVDMLPAMERYLAAQQVDKRKGTLPETPKVSAKKKIDVKSYKSLIDFIYEHMTIDGIVDKTIQLGLPELKAMKKLIADELKSKKVKK